MLGLTWDRPVSLGKHRKVVSSILFALPLGLLSIFSFGCNLSASDDLVGGAEGQTAGNAPIVFAHGFLSGPNASGMVEVAQTLTQDGCAACPLTDNEADSLRAAGCPDPDEMEPHRAWCCEGPEAEGGLRIYIPTLQRSAVPVERAQCLAEHTNIAYTKWDSRVHLVGHSQGGVDSTVLTTELAFQEVHPLIVSLTTLGSPLAGSTFAQYFLGKEQVNNAVASLTDFANIFGVEEMIFSGVAGLFNHEVLEKLANPGLGPDPHIFTQHFQMASRPNPQHPLVAIYSPATAEDQANYASETETLCNGILHTWDGPVLAVGAHLDDYQQIVALGKFDLSAQWVVTSGAAAGDGWLPNDSIVSVDSATRGNPYMQRVGTANLAHIAQIAGLSVNRGCLVTGHSMGETDRGAFYGALFHELRTVPVKASLGNAWRKAGH